MIINRSVSYILMRCSEIALNISEQLGSVKRSYLICMLQELLGNATHARSVPLGSPCGGPGPRACGKPPRFLREIERLLSWTLDSDLLLETGSDQCMAKIPLFILLTLTFHLFRDTQCSTAFLMIVGSDFDFFQFNSSFRP